MNPARVAERGLAALDPRGARLSGYRLVFNKVSTKHPGVAHANIQFAPGWRVEGVLYDLMSDEEIFKMDPFERAPWNYGRDVVQVETVHGAEWCWTYFANPAVLKPDLAPPRAYLDHLLAGEPFLSDEYIAYLRDHPVGDHG